MADPGFLEGGSNGAVAREACARNFEAMPTLTSFLRETISPTSPINLFLNEFSAKAC